jgi:ketopantoate reductase
MHETDNIQGAYIATISPAFEDSGLMRTLVVGAGATGGYFGARLAAAGRDITFLVRERRLEQLRRDGIRIISPRGDLTLTLKLVTAAELSVPYDLILPASEPFVARTRTMLTKAGSPLTSSMYRDLVAGNDVEADAILGDLVERARSGGLVTPLLATAYTNLKVYQGRR